MPLAPQALPASQPCILASASSLNSMRPRSPPAPPPAPPCRSPVAYCMPAGCGAPGHRNIERRRGFLTAARCRPACALGADGRLRIRKRHCRAARAPSLLPIVPCKGADGRPHAPALRPARTRRLPTASSLPSRATPGRAGFARSCTRSAVRVRSRSPTACMSAVLVRPVVRQEVCRFLETRLFPGRAFST